MVSKGRLAEREQEKSRPKARPIRVFVEGGGGKENKALQLEAQKAFASIIKRGARLDVHVVASGGRERAFDQFKTECRIDKGVPILLVDAEGPVVTIDEPWAHLKVRDDWDAPPNVTNDHAFLMVHTMEAWLLSDPDALAKALGTGFNLERIPKWPALEGAPKAALYDALKNASSACKSPYDKGAHSFAALLKGGC